VKPVRWLLSALAVVVCATVLMAAAAVWSNNRAVEPPGRAELAASFERGVAWMEHQGGGLLNQRNVVLWWMVREAAKESGDARLARLLDCFEGRYDHLRGNMWRHFLDEQATEPLDWARLARLPDYDRYFFYALTCDARLGAEEDIVRQHEADFCEHGARLLRPACVTHQLMGMRFRQRRGCSDQAAVGAVVAHLHDRIVGQLTWDPRVLDVYLQRVLMLVESGAAARVKPVWLRRVVAAQRPDGGWSAYQPILHLGGSRVLCFTPRGVGLARIRSNFHATAQGVWLMSLLAYR